MISEEVKQVIVVRKDLHMRKGKMCAQSAHASMKVLLDMMHVDEELSGYSRWSFSAKHETPLWKWLKGRFAKIVVYVNSEKELLDLYVDAQLANIPNALIQDAGITEIKEPTYTCIAIGPDYSEEIDKITGKLPLI
jgi:PTH2 family peptidyl-tRNA hydrolase